MKQTTNLADGNLSGGLWVKKENAPFQNVNDVPIFMDLNLRLATPGNENENEACFPMYLSYQDLYALSYCT